ncbi:hypothetical protein FSOLCH5_15556 [Fusarium solani]
MLTSPHSLTWSHHFHCLSPVREIPSLHHLPTCSGHMEARTFTFQSPFLAIGVCPPTPFPRSLSVTHVPVGRHGF